MKIVFGGAFNPVTLAHIEVYKYVMNLVDADEFIFLPVSNAYTKSELISNYHRVRMLEIALKGYENTSISKLEIIDTDYLGTYQSLIRLSDQHNDDISFVIGADNLKELRNWRNLDSLLSEFKIIVLNRNNEDILKLIKNDERIAKYENSFIILNDFNINISSTMFRNTKKKELLDDEVYEYIIDNNLFEGE